MKVRVLLDPPVRPKRRRAGAVDWIRRLFLLVGMIAVGYAGYVYLDSQVYQRYEDWSFDQEAAGKTPSVGDFIHDETAKAGDSAAAPSADDSTVDKPAPQPERARTPKDPSLIGRIAIPRLNVHAIVKEGVDDRTLRRAVGHIPGTARPGMDGNVALAAHRDSFFRGLQNVRKNDRIVMETLDARYEYVVDSLKIVDPDDVQVLAASNAPVLTLVTCYPFHYVGNAPRRFIVRARQVSVQARNGGGAQAGT